MSSENWTRAYSEAPEVFDAFCLAEDPAGLVTDCLRRHARLQGREILEIGCGTGRYSARWRDGTARYVALERSTAMLALACRRDRPAPCAEWICGDATRLPFGDGSFDGVLAGWVFGNLRPAARRVAMDEALRVLRPGSRTGLWLIENHWSGEFHELRGRSSAAERQRIGRMMRDHGLTLVELIETELLFASVAEARRVLGWLCGEGVREALSGVSVGHHVMLLHRAT